MASILNVDQIRNAAGTSAMTIDSSGRITKPQQIAFLASNGSGTHTTNVGAVLDFSSVKINQGNNYNSSTYTFTAPVAGLYNFYFQVYAHGATTSKAIAYQKNGSDYLIEDTAIGHQGTVNIGDNTISSNLLMELAVNDAIRIAVRTGSSNLSWYGGHSWFQGYFIG